jgi:CcmD family protein
MKMQRRRQWQRQRQRQISARLPRWLRDRVLGVLSIAAALLAAAPARALAQEFVKVEGKLADNVPAVPFVGIAYGVIWLAVLVYVVSVARGLGRVNAEIAELRRKIDGAGASRK